MSERDEAERRYAESLTPGEAREQVLICEGCGQRLPFDITIEHHCPGRQGGDHEAGIEAATNAVLDHLPAGSLSPESHRKRAHRLAYAAVSAFSRVPSPVSGTEPMVEAERMEHWKNRAVDAEMKLTQVSGTEPDTATLVEALREALADSEARLDSPLDRAAHAYLRERESAGTAGGAAKRIVTAFLDAALAGFSVDAGKARSER